MGNYNNLIMIRVTDQYFWNFVFSVFFTILLIMGVIILDTESRIPFSELELVDYVLIALASWRVTRLFVYDSITKFVREQFWDVKKVGKQLRLEKPKTGIRRSLADLFDCPWCFSVWSTAAIAFFYLITPYSEFPIIILALSGVATLLQIISNLIGHQAEHLKIR